MSSIRLATWLAVVLVLGESRHAEPIISFPTHHDENLYTSAIELDEEQRASLDKGDNIILPSVFIGLESDVDSDVSGDMMDAITKAAAMAEVAVNRQTSADASRFARMENTALPPVITPANDNVPGPVIPKPDPMPTPDPSESNATDAEPEEAEPLFPDDASVSIKEPKNDVSRATSDRSPHASSSMPYMVHVGSHYYCGCMLYGMPRKLHCSVSFSAMLLRASCMLTRLIVIRV
jgi:hypothetical protein